MAFHGLCFFIVVLIVKASVVYVQGEIIKSSLTFVIDYTRSMEDEIRAVKDEVSMIFDKVLSSKSSQIENFVIATFNDPAAEVRIITKNPDEFRKALESITLHSDYNTDCPEKSMTGIELGLTHSLPLSYLYVFTDASATDFYKLEQIKSLSQKKQSQVVFLLTGLCYGSTTDPRYLAYHEVAKASGGQVFHMMKSDVKDILKYIEESIKDRGVPLINKKYGPGTHKVKFNVDARTDAVLISLTGPDAKIGVVTGPDGSVLPTEPIVSGKDNMAVRRLNDAKPGDYEVEIEGQNVHIIMIAKSDLNFQLGFSTESPTSMIDTVTRPPPEGNAFLGIRLLAEGVELTTAKILDLNDNIIAELPLTLVDKKEQLYVTSSFNPPNSIFLVTVSGTDLNSGTTVTRTSPTPIARQNPATEPAVNTPLEVTIQGAPKIIAEYDAPLKLKCNVHGYPKPDIVWTEKGTGVQLAAKVNLVDVPYDYVSILDIDKANKDVFYQCEASNSLGTTITYVEVKTKRKNYFTVVEAPKDILIEYTKEGSIVCKIDAYPPATITWYKDGAEFSGDSNVEISSDKSILSIKNMQPELQGKYKCEAKNAIDQKDFVANVDIFGAEEPVIDKSHRVDRVTETTDTKLSCNILKGIPKPDLSWSFKPAGVPTFSVMAETTETVHLNNVRKDQTGTYKCNAKNALKSDSFDMELIVEYPPIIGPDVTVKSIKAGDEVRIPCDVTGEPVPTVTWFVKGTELTSSATISVNSDNSIKFKATPSDMGDYTCEAKNKLKTVKKTVYLDVLEKPVIEKSVTKIHVPEKTVAELSCKILQGNPKPSISWTFTSATTGTSTVMKETTEVVHLNDVNTGHTGTYKCSAVNNQGPDDFSMVLIVEYPPIIGPDVTVKSIKAGDEVRIPCDVTGEPVPTVTWFVKGTELTSSATISVNSDNSIKFKATPSDMGDYTCEAKNKLKTVKKTVYLDVLEKPVIEKSVTKIHVPEKTVAELSCKILQGNPKPSISWTFTSATTGTSTVMKETTEVVHLNDVNTGHTGTYKCSAVNNQGPDDFSMVLIVEYPPIIGPDVTVKSIKAGDEVRIPCDVTGEPVPTVTWFVKGTELTSSATISVNSDNSIKFKATPSDMGDYTCEAKNKLKTVKKTVYLDVLEKPVIEKSVTKIHVPEKTVAELSCKILQGNPKPSISWTFTSATTGTSTVMKETTEVVHLNDVNTGHTGTYKCSALNNQGPDDFSMVLIVEYPPIIGPDVTVKSIKAGDEVRIPCDVTGEPVPTVTWFVKGTELTSSATISVNSDNSIKFKATPSDMGDYTCEAKNKLKTVKKTVYLDVLEKPVIDKSVTKIHVPEKTVAELSCKILQGNPKPSISWTFTSATTGTSTVMKETTEVVHLNDVNTGHTGTYKCSAVNNQGPDDFSMVLIVEYPPIIGPDVTVKSIKAGDEVRIPCDVTGEPVPTVTWFVKGTELTSSATISVNSDNSIKFKATPSDMGDYTCEAKNKLKTVKKTVYLDVLEKPVIEKSVTKIHVPEKTVAELSCKILQGNPKPSISWTFTSATTGTSTVMKETTEVVHLNDVNTGHTGTYKCSALNNQGPDDFSMVLIVEYPPIIGPDVTVKSIKAGDEVRIPCDVTGEPVPTVTWFVKGTELTSSATISVNSDNSIKFKATPSDMGDYTCEAKNKLKTVKKTVYLDVLEKPVIDKSVTKIHVPEKTVAELSCKILQGNPKPSISWTFTSATTGTSTVMKETSEVVHLNDVNTGHTGTYKCSALNNQGPDDFSMVLIVEYPPIIGPDVTVKSIKAGDEVRIPCDVTGEPVPTVTWFVKGTELTSSATISVNSDNSIKFKATPYDIGDYTCEAKNKLKTAKKSVYLDVLEKPVIDKSVTKIHVPEKTVAELSCKILQGNPKPSISWTFTSATTGTSTVMKETTEVVHLNDVNTGHTGTYKCSALNNQGPDDFSMVLIVEYPPIIKKDLALLKIKAGDEVRIPCDVTGEPAPSVNWFFYDILLGNSPKAVISSDHSYRFKAGLPDIGFYRCEAINKFGVAQETTELQVYIPVTIKTIPKVVNAMVGKSAILKCEAIGYPEPNIKWTFRSLDPKIPAKDITPTGGVTSVSLRHMQLDQQGSYTCEAENGIGGSTSITYNVNVYAPPVIVNTYLSKTFEVMEGDVALRIHVKVTGNPKPVIVWKKNGLGVPMGSKWYDMEDDGTLIIKHIDRKAEGSYICHAVNIFAVVTEQYDVTVLDHLVAAVPSSTIFVKEGETVKINCGIPHRKTDQMRWYKGSLAIGSMELTLKSVTRRDDDLYTCRVSNEYKSQSVTTKVVVEYKPAFMTVEKEIIEFIHGAPSVILSCEAYGQPMPTKVTWKHNDNILAFMKMSYPLKMVYNAIGTYECEVSNALGSIRRTFKVTSKDCILDINKDFPQKQPLMLSSKFTWPEFKVKYGYMIIPHADYFYMYCPSLFSNPTLPEYPMVYCERDNTVKINGIPLNFADIQCNKEVKPQVSRSGNPCLRKKTENVEIGFKVKSKFLGVYEVCLDTENNVPLFTKHTLSPHHTDRSTEATWSNSKLPQDFDSLYDCRRQMYDITSTIGRGLSTRDSCCFGKRQLVSSHNLSPGVPTSSAYEYLNVSPHWSTCNSKNWENMEQSVRKLVKSVDRDLIISTGTANPRRGGASTDITLHDGYGEKQSVAPYLWKVVQDRALSASVAIIQINIPELTATEATKHVLCTDICGAISWLEPDSWQNADDGYTYCCSIFDFEKAFGYNGRFSPLMKNILL